MEVLKEEELSEAIKLSIEQALVQTVRIRTKRAAPLLIVKVLYPIELM